MYKCIIFAECVTVRKFMKSYPYKRETERTLKKEIKEEYSGLFKKFDYLSYVNNKITFYTIWHC